MNRLRTAALLAVPALLAGCSAPTPSPRAESPVPSAPVAPASTDEGGAPTLASEVAARNRRESDGISQTIGVKVEEQAKAAAPEWFVAAATTSGRGAGSALAPKLQDAIQNAITKAGSQVSARGGNPQSLKVERAAYTRLPTGQYAAWAALGDGTNMGEPVAPAQAPAPVVELATNEPAAAPLPTLAQPKAPIATGVEAEAMAATTAPAPAAAMPGLNDPKATVATGGPQVVAATATATESATATAPQAAAAAAQPAAAGDAIIVLPDLKNPTQVVATVPANVVYAPDPGNAPTWWTPGAAQRGTRVAVGIRVEGKDARECSRASLLAGREQLEAATGSAPKQLLTDKTVTFKLADGRLRTYSIVSCVGTLKTDPAK